MMSKLVQPDPSYRISFETDEDVGQVLAEVKQQGHGAIKMYIQRLIREDSAKKRNSSKRAVAELPAMAQGAM